MAKTLKLSLISAVIVSCMQPTGYRRAGLSFNQGKNEIPADGLDQEQLDAIENDPRLSVQAIPLDASTTPQSQLDANNLGADLAPLNSMQALILWMRQSTYSQLLQS